MGDNNNETAELIGMMREVHRTVNSLAARLDRHMAETDTRLDALRIDLAAEKKSSTEWLTSYIMHSGD